MKRTRHERKKLIDYGTKLTRKRLGLTVGSTIIITRTSLGFVVRNEGRLRYELDRLGMSQRRTKLKSCIERLKSWG